ncbi:MAG: NAD(+) synthase [Vampirovibrionales bacterium]|nr:NAD(+) synthase [Vampirovibrionales bacterium]
MLSFETLKPLLQDVGAFDRAVKQALEQVSGNSASGSLPSGSLSSESPSGDSARLALVEVLNAVLDLALQQKASVSGDVLEKTCDILKRILGGFGQGTLGLAQINPTPGDIAGNAAQVIAHMEIAEAIGLDALIFPELALMGYLIEDVILKHPHLVAENMAWLEAIARRTGKTKVLLGFVEPRPYQNNNGLRRIGKPFFNSLAVLSNGKIEGVVRKALLPNYGEFNDYRTFEPTAAYGLISPECLGSKNLGQDVQNASQDKVTLLEIGKTRYGLSICEDLWNNDQFISHPLYHHDPIKALADAGADVIINVSASPSRAQKEPLRHQLLSETARRYQTPLVYVNQVGSVDGVNFDGISRLYGSDGALLARAKSFLPQFLIVNPRQAVGHIEALPEGLEESLHKNAQKDERCFDPTHADDLARTYGAIVQGIRDYFSKTGFKRAVLGLSGGLDSSVTAVLLADALGAENVIGVSMPSTITPGENKTDAKTLAKNLGIHFTELPIGEQVEGAEAFARQVETELADSLGQPSLNSTGKDNVQAMVRALNLRRLGNDYNALPIATSDKSELYMGYATINGDMSGAIAPIGDVVKTKVRALAYWLNQNPSHLRNNPPPIPLRVIEKPSGADLKINPKTGLLVSAEEELMPYLFLDEAIWRLEFTHADFETLLAADFIYEQEMATQGTPLTKAQKKQWLEKFYRRMAATVFKWHVAPPILIVDGYGISRGEYHRPIVAKLNFEPLDIQKIEREVEKMGRLPRSSLFTL